jgi:hypothetical protein
MRRWLACFVQLLLVSSLSFSQGDAYSFGDMLKGHEERVPLVAAWKWKKSEALEASSRWMPAAKLRAK